jgi:anti-sigma B factor antagonist
VGVKRKKNSTLRVKDSMTAVNISKLRDRLGRALAKSSDFTLDLSKVGEMDSAGFQLLAALKREADDTGKTFGITAFSPAVSSVLKLFNMAEYFGMDDAFLGVTDNEAEGDVSRDAG